MADSSPRFGFTILNTPTDRLDYEDWKFGRSDRHLLDRLLAYGEHHSHNGRAAVVEAPPAPELTVATTGGVIPAGATVFYKYCLVDNKGQEELASVMGVAHTPAQLPAPKVPRLAIGAIGGSLPAGIYSYAVSAYTGTPSQETPISPLAVTTLRQVGYLQISLPDPPSGATGFNVYRKGPMDTEMYLLMSVPADQGSVGDAGLQQPDRRHLVPTANTTNTTNSITVALPSAIPDDYTVRVYRTFVPTHWENSLLTWTANSSVVDGGRQTQYGSPALTSAAVGGAPQINLENMAEAEGVLPPGKNAVPVQVSFTQEGPVEVGYGVWFWVCEYDEADVVAYRAQLGSGSAPAAQEVQVKLQKWVGGSWVDCVSGSEVVTIAVGENTGEFVEPITYPWLAGDVRAHFERGDMMRMVVLQSGGGATPTDENLVVSVMLRAHAGSTTTTHAWETA